MKKIISISALIVILVSIIFVLTGCGEKESTVTYNNVKEKVSVSFNCPESEKCRISENGDDLRTSREDAVLIGNSFKIAIQIDSLLGTFEDLKKDEYADITYNNIKGFSYYYGAYNRYEILLPINNDNYLALHVYKTDYDLMDKDSLDSVYNSETVQKILNTVTITEQ